MIIKNNIYIYSLHRINRSSIFIERSIGIKFENKVKNGDANNDSKMMLCLIKCKFSLGISLLI